MGLFSSITNSIDHSVRSALGNRLGTSVLNANPSIGARLASGNTSIDPKNPSLLGQYATYKEPESIDRRQPYAAADERAFVATLPGGKWSDDPYERAQQQRNFHQTDAFKKSGHWDPLNPGKQLEEQAGTTAYNFRQGLGSTELDARNDIAKRAAGTLDQGVHTIRSGANNRGLLYSGIRQGAEGDFRGKVASTMASQIAASNADLNKQADSLDRTAAQAGLLGAQKVAEAQAEADRMTRENAVARAQQWQQLGTVIGYGLTELPDYMKARRVNQGTGAT